MGMPWRSYIRERCLRWRRRWCKRHKQQRRRRWRRVAIQKQHHGNSRRILLSACRCVCRGGNKRQRIHIQYDFLCRLRGTV